VSRTTYTEEQKAEALALYVEHGASEAGERTGIPAGTIACWASRVGATTERARKRDANIIAIRQAKEELREEIRTQALERALITVSRITEDVAAADAKNLAIAFGTLLDKYRLEMGEASGFMEHRAASADRVQALRDEVAERRERRQQVA